MSSRPDTIAAIATAIGRAGVGVVRISGVDLSSISKKLLGQKLVPRHATYLPFLDSSGATIDQGIAIYFPAPNSYTGEEVLELQGHGGVVLQLILQHCLVAGARLAQPGEFTLRAFLNNKLDLIQAESVADLIDASSELAARSALRSLQGGFSKTIDVLVKHLVDLRIQVESSLDFPEEDIAFSDIVRHKSGINKLLAELEQVFNLAKQGSILREGAHIVLVGEPNVGKSSLLNQLSGEEVALVSEIAGTTRDAIHQVVNIKGVPLHIIDTAGLQETQDVVEQMGMARTRLSLQKADMALLLMDIQHENRGISTKVLEAIPKNIPRLHIINKIDLLNQQARIETRNQDVYIYLSAKTGTGLELLREKILQLIGWQAESGAFMARERHLQALLLAKKYLNEALLEQGGIELLAENLRLAQDTLSKITGEFSADQLLGEIFGRFCIGK